jgi:membrane associated rhomboid family serine protease
MLWISVDVPMERIPFTNWLLMAATVVGSIYYWAPKPHAADFNVERHIDPALIEKLQDPKLTPKQREAVERQIDRQLQKAEDEDAALPGALNPRRFAPSQLVTHLFVHGDIVHLLANMLFLFCFGNAVNAKLGHLTFLALYFACGAFAGLAWLLLGSGVPVIGASGAISGITGAFLVLYPLNEISYYDELSLRWFGDAWRFSSYWFILAYMTLDLIGTLGRFGGVAYLCHLAGECLGFGVTVGLVLAGVVRSGRGETNLLEAMGFAVAKPKRRRKRRRRPPPEDGE